MRNKYIMLCMKWRWWGVAGVTSEDASKAAALA
jgi:hypothetical protein